MVRKEEKKAINLQQVTAYLSAAFSKATRHLGNKNNIGTPLYDYQVEFCWLQHEITTGPSYIAPKVIQEANDLIAEIEGKSRIK